MAIYELFEQEKQEEFTETFERAEEISKKKSSLFSTLITRVCFLLLLIADLAWLVFNAALLVVVATFHLAFATKNSYFKKTLPRIWLHFIRSLACALSLFIGLFTPPFGIMVACTYFLMYDKAGMEEVVPAPLQGQFKDLFKG